ncbi:hypothetical protein G5I_13274 [Acromyrmex echinatior]|uniref:Uncharacterized protein n=1 Tax=Acromyrmex echinatior TaxID=103372 RepID=F4X4K8_ACREC|nr:hypothetical protein G5I_13274 [Acromyrmex echinatior]
MRSAKLEIGSIIRSLRSESRLCLRPAKRPSNIPYCIAYSPAAYQFTISNTALSTLVYLHKGHVSSLTKTANGLPPGRKERNRFIAAATPEQAKRSLLTINSFVVPCGWSPIPHSKRSDQSDRRNDNNSLKQRHGTTPMFVTAKHELASRFYDRESNGSEIINV